MQQTTQKYDIGVIVGRFQVHELHEAHLELINHVCDEHDKVVVILGLSPLMNTANNPLDFESRKQMILEAFPHVNVLYARDMSSDEIWSKNLDAMINDLCTPGQSAVFYGSRDSFIARYSGRFPTRELESKIFLSGTELRRGIARSRTRPSADFRAGAIWAAASRFPTAYTTVDVAIFGDDGRRLLLGRKPNEKLYRFIGGFSDPSSDSFEQDARREVAEETGLSIANLTYIGSMKVNDWRYKPEADCIKTMFFSATRMFGLTPRPNDDIEEVRWFDLPENMTDAYKSIEPHILGGHRRLLAMLFGQED